MLDITQEEINLSRELALEKVELGNAFDRLMANKDFDKIVTKGFFEDECVRLVLTKAEPSMATPEHQANILKDIDGIGTFRQYLINLRREAAMAVKALEDYQELENELDNAEEE